MSTNSMIQAMQSVRTELLRAEHHAYLGSQFWKQRREQALVEQGRFCAFCRGTRHLQVHHIPPHGYERRGRERNCDVIVLCEYHHRVSHGPDHPQRAAVLRCIEEHVFRHDPDQRHFTSAEGARIAARFADIDNVDVSERQKRARLRGAEAERLRDLKDRLTPEGREFFAAMRKLSPGQRQALAGRSPPKAEEPGGRATTDRRRLPAPWPVGRRRLTQAEILRLAPLKPL